MRTAWLNVLLTSLLLLAVCSDATPVTRTEVHSISRRSEEFHAYLARQQRQTSDPCPSGTWYNNRAACASVNYNQFDALGRRASGLLAAPMDQGTCGSCWAFASTGTFTDLRNLAAGQSTSDLSPQSMTTCYTKYSKDNGCCGVPIILSAYWLKTVGTVTAKCVPYEHELQAYVYSEDQTENEELPECRLDTCVDDEIPFNVVKAEGYSEVQEEGIIAAINRGPVIARMFVPDKRVETFSRYARGCGVYCSSDKPTGTETDSYHAVEIVDYGTTDSGIDFYVVKNSWGTGWGEDGYFRIRRGDLEIGMVDVFELVLTSGISKRSFPDTIPFNKTSFQGSVSVCSIESVPNPSSNEVIMIVANFVIEELNRRSSIRCPDKVTVAGPITLSSVMAATTQAVAGTNYVVTMRVQVMGCGDIINANISAEVFQEFGGNFTLAAYTYSSGMAVSVSLMLLLGAAVLALLPNY